ncbi:MAG: hypothetical protein Q9218_000491 [Villophora microphyllina]
MYRYMVSFSTVLALSVLSAAQSSAQSSISAQTTATLLLIHADPQSLVGSIVGTNGAATTYQLQCQPGTGSEDCGFPGPFTYIKDGTSSIQYAFDLEGITASVACSLQGTDSAVCTANEPAAAVSGDDVALPTGISIQGSQAVATETLSGSDLVYFTIPITGGASAAATAAATTVKSTGTLSMKPTKGGSTTGTSGTATGTATGQSSPSPSGSTGGAAGLDVRTSTLALVGAAALAAVLI